jgi:RNA polymerase sigma-70 factor (ECF subfamily)
LVEEHYASLYRYAYRLSGRAADAEDLTQEAFCQAQRKLAQLRDWSRAKAWLFSILRNAYLHRVRDRKMEKVIPLDSAGELPGRVPDPMPDIDPERLQQALSELDELYRTPLILYYFEDFSYRDIAEQMDLPMGTVMSRLARAKAWLRGRLLPAAVPAPHRDSTSRPRKETLAAKDGANHGL